MNPLRRLKEHGQSYWIDDLNRRMIRSGQLRRRIIDEGLAGVTSNPTIFHKAISGSQDYEAQIRESLLAHKTALEIYRDLVVTDVRDACALLRPIYDESEAADGYVSLEVSPHLAHDAEATIAEAKLLHDAVLQSNLFIKIPGTAAGLPSIEQCLVDGVNVNITLLFSVDRYEAVSEAYLRALERRAAAGRSLDRVASVASFFLSRIDVLVDALIAQRLGEARSLLGKAAIASAKLAYQGFKRVLQSDRWRVLAEKGARPQRLVWASTSSKNPDYSDVKYVEPLIGPYTVNTMPESTIAAFAEHGRVGSTLEQGLDEAQRVIDDLRGLDIGVEHVAWQLEHEGVRKFIEPYQALLKLLPATPEHKDQ